MLDTLSDLDALIRSEVRFIYVDTLEEGRLLEHFRQLASEGRDEVHCWTAADGVIDLRTGSGKWGTSELVDALKWIKAQATGVFVVFDVGRFLSDPVVDRLLKEIAGVGTDGRQTLIVVGNGLDLPADLKRLGESFVPPLPDADAVREIYYEEVYRWLTERRGRRFVKPGDMEDKLVKSLVGLTEEDVRRLVAQSIRNDSRITDEDIDRILAFKRENSGKAGLVEFETETLGFDKVGGLENLKEWLALRRDAFLDEAAGLHLDPPKGILLLGVQGAGKSLAAKAVAGTWQVPLVRLDFSNLYQKWVGQSEQNLKEALRQAEVLEPCVLWIDEIEKGIVGETTSDADGGLSRRILGTLLTWMAERKSRVFMVATANDVSRLPPELLRKGRFDEIFFVDLPAFHVRRDIFAIHLAKRGLAPAHFHLDDLARGAEGYSGAEIEQAVVGGMYLAAGRKEAPTTRHLLEELARTKPLSIVMGERIAALRAWAQGRTVPADRSDALLAGGASPSSAGRYASRLY